MNTIPIFAETAENEAEARWWQTLADKFDVLDSARDSYAVTIIGAHDWFFGPGMDIAINGHRYLWDNTAATDADQWRRIVREYGENEGITAVCVDAVRLEDYEDEQTFPLITFVGPLALVQQALVAFLSPDSVPSMDALARYLTSKERDA